MNKRRREREKEWYAFFVRREPLVVPHLCPFHALFSLINDFLVHPCSSLADVATERRDGDRPTEQVKDVHCRPMRDGPSSLSLCAAFGSSRAFVLAFVVLCII